jgi:ketosteroid isomerase-like protein
MSQENVELVQSAFAAYDRGDLHEMLSGLSDNLVTHRPDPDDAHYHGPEGFLQAMADWIEDFDDWTITAKEVIDTGDSVIARAHQAAHGERSGAFVELEIWMVFAFDDESKVERITFFRRRTDAFEAVGLAE